MMNIEIIGKTMVATIDIFIGAGAIIGMNKDERRTAGAGIAIFAILNIIAMLL